jgi:hypothetical protein
MGTPGGIPVELRNLAGLTILGRIRPLFAHPAIPMRPPRRPTKSAPVELRPLQLTASMARSKAADRGTKRLPQQGGDTYSIVRADFRQFVIDNLELIDFR